MIRNVLIGQHWTLFVSPFASNKITARVSAIEGDVVRLEVLFHGEVKRTTSTQLRTLRHGLRGAKLVRNADGSEPAAHAQEPEPYRAPAVPPLAKSKRPRGVLRRPLSERQLEIERLVATG